jgi:acetyltransferase-like isoleucine patch superfamily enzyme
MSKHTAATWLGALVGGLRRWPSWFWCLEARLKGVQFDGRALFLGRPLISVAKGGRIQLGDGVQVNSAVRANPLACPQPSVLRAMGPGAELVLARQVGLSATVLCAARRIEVGEGTIFGAGAMVIDNDFHMPEGEWGWNNDCQAKARPIRIGRGVFIGARAIVLKGVTIGDRAVIGAGAVVACDVAAGHIAVGNPAQSMPRRGEAGLKVEG